MLAAAVRGDRVDYDVLRRRRPELEAYLDRLAAARIEGLAPAQTEALLINAYNAATVLAVLDHPKAASIKEIPGVWTRTRRRVGGFELTLDDIEHRLLRPFFKDPRIHFAVNCASVSCAPLPPWAMDGDRLEAQLEERARVFLGDRRHVRLEGGVLKLSRYFDWYGGDFTGDGWRGSAPTVALYAARYAGDGVAQFVDSHHGAPPVEFLDYDWSLNAVPAAPPGPEPGPAPR